MGTLPNLSVVKGPTRTLKSNNRLDKIFENIAKSPSSANNLALLFEENGKIQKHTYAELDEITDRLSRFIRKIVQENRLPKNGDGDFVLAVSAKPSDKLVMVLLAAWKAGAAYLPLDPSFPAGRVEHIVNESRPFMIIYEEDATSFGTTFKMSLQSFVDSAGDCLPVGLKAEERLQHRKDDLAIVLYTSGSTGVPKGVRLPHSTILNRLQWQFRTFPYAKTERNCVFKTALTFVDSISELWGPLVSGLTIIVVSKNAVQNPEKLVSLMESQKIERLVLVPSLLRTILLYVNLTKNRRYLESLKTWVCSGEILTTALAREFYDYFGFDSGHRLCNFYGSTEIMGDVTYHVVATSGELSSRTKVPIGLPVDNTIVYLLDPDYRPVRAGDVGELFVSGLNLAAGYVNDRDPEKFLENPLAVDPTFGRLYRTGDYARLVDGTLIYEGRTDSQVKVRGHRVDLSEIERALNGIKGVDKGVVLCHRPGEPDQAILAFATTDGSLNEHGVEQELKEKLSAYMVPQVILIDEVPLLVNGKTDRQSLLKSYEKSNDGNNNSDHNLENGRSSIMDYDGVPESQLSAAKVLFETISLILGKSVRSVISIDANFYEIGGNSLNSIFTITKLNEQGYYISIGDFIAAIDLGEILERMTSGRLNFSKFKTQPPVYTMEMLEDKHRKDVIDMVTTSFYQKADLERWLISEISEDDYKDLIEKLWEALVEKDLSFVIKTELGRIVGVSLCFDARDEPEVEVKSRLSIIFEFLESLEGPVRDLQLPPGRGKILHSFMMATKSSLSPKDNVAVIQFMEDETLKLAKRKKFAGVFTTNTSPLTQQLGSDVYNYQTCLDYQVNEYVASDDTKPFALAPNSQRALVQWKPIQ